MRALLVALALAGGFTPSIPSSSEPAVHVAQMARDVTGAVRKQRNERRQQNYQSTEEKRR